MGAIKRGFVQLKVEREQKGGFVKGRFWRMCPRSGFWYRGTSECTLALVFVTGEHLPKPPFWKPPFREPPKKGPSVPLRGALLDCLIVGHSPGLNCIGPRGASKDIGFGRT